MNEDKIPAELQMKLDEVETQNARNRRKRFDPQKGVYMGLLCLGLFFTFAIVMRAGVFSALGFGVIGGFVGFVCGACQRPTKQ